jgi:hypothetical protein
VAAEAVSVAADPVTNEERIRVACAIGNFILGFNQVDMLTHRAMSVLCDEPMLWALATREWEFERRRALILKLLDKRVAPADLTEEWKREWELARAMAEYRNHIAHGQMSALGNAGQSAEERFGVVSLKKLAGKKTDFDMKLGQIDTLSTELYALVHRLNVLIDRADSCPWKDRLILTSKASDQS